MEQLDFDLQRKVEKYYQLTIYGRWIFIAALWLTLGVYSFWNLRQEIARCLDYFTWSAVYYSLAFNLVPTLCLSICIGTTLGTLLRQSCHILWGLSDKEKYYLTKKVEKILATGSSHPLWKWINK